MTLYFDFICSGLGTCGALVVSLIANLTGWVGKPFLHPVQSPFWVLALCECFPEMLHHFWRSSGLLQTVFSLYVRVLITLYLAERWWWLSHCRYWSVWVGFLYTVIDNLPSVSGFTMVSKKGMAPSSLLSSTVNPMVMSTQFMCSRKFYLWSSFWMTNASSTYLSHNLGGEWVAVLRAFCSKYSM